MYLMHAVIRKSKNYLKFSSRHFDELCGTEDFLNLTLENLTNFLRDDDTRGFELDFFWGVLRSHFFSFHGSVLE